MKKLLFLLPLLLFLPALVLPFDEYLIENFEKKPAWSVFSDAQKNGLKAELRYLEGGPGALRESTNGAPESIVLGLKVQFPRMDQYEISVRPKKPYYLGRGVMSVGGWVCGRNTRHSLKLSLQYQYGKDIRDLEQLEDEPCQRLDWVGWKIVSFSVPDFYMVDKRDFYFNGFKIICHPLDAVADFFVYFDHVTFFK